MEKQGQMGAQQKEKILREAFEACKDNNGVATNLDISKFLLEKYALRKDDISKNRTLTGVYETLGFEATRTEDDPTKVFIKKGLAKKQSHKKTRNKADVLFEFAFFPPSFDVNIESLAKMAMPEQWGKKYGYLKQYLIEHFFIISTSKPDLLCFDADKTQACFNTGLLTPNFQDIFAFFEKPKGKLDKFIFKGFLNESGGQLANFKKLPDTIEFYTKIEEIYFDTSLEIRLNKDHILGENIGRFPEWFAQLPTLQKNSFLDGLINNMKIRIKRNYRTAVPQWYNNKVCFLLPLCLSGENINSPELLLTCEKKDGFYYIATCLTPEMAYTNARIIAKPESDWLKP